MKIRKIEKDDIFMVQRISIEQFGNESWTEKNFYETLNNSNNIFYGLFDGLKLVCFCICLLSLDDCNILYIATKQEEKRKGYAKSLFQFVKDLVSKDVKTLSLEVKQENKAAIEFYEKMGFKTLNIRKKYYKDGQSALCMWLNL